MIRFSSMIERLQGQLIDNSTDTETMIKAWINDAVSLLCVQVAIPELARELTLSPDSDGEVVLPGSMQSITEITDDDRDIRFTYERGSRGMVNTRETEYLYCDVGMVLTSGDTETVTCTQGSMTVTADSTTAAEVGDIVSFTGVDGFFDVTAVETDETGLTIMPWYPSTTGSTSMVVNPAGRRKIALYNSAGTAYTDDIICMFQMRHPELVNDADMILLNAPNAIYYNVLKRALERGKYQVDSLYLDKQTLKAETLELSGLKKDHERMQLEREKRNMGLFSLHRRRG